MNSSVFVVLLVFDVEYICLQNTLHTVRFVITIAKDKLAKLIEKYEVEKTFKLFDTKRTNMGNMHMYNSDGKITLYKNEQEIMEEFFKTRMITYTKRKNYMIEKLKYDVRTISARAKFIMAVINEEIDLRMKTDEDVNLQLEKLELPKLSKLTYEEDDDSSKKKEPTYDYLVTMPMRSLTKKKVDELMKKKDDIETELALLEASTEKDLWINDLKLFENAYERMMTDFNDKNEIEGAATKVKTSTKKKAPVKAKTGIKIKVIKKSKDDGSSDDSSSSL